MQKPIGVIFEKGKVVLVNGELKYDVMYTITDWNPAGEQFTIEDVEGNSSNSYGYKEEWIIDFEEGTYMVGEFNDFTLVYENPSSSKRVPGGVIFESGKAKINEGMKSYYKINEGLKSYYDLDKEYKIVRYWEEAEIFSCIDNDGDIFWFVFNTNDNSEDFEHFDNYEGSVTFVHEEIEFYEVW
jgi:hypothetical protein